MKGQALVEALIGAILISGFCITIINLSYKYTLKIFLENQLEVFLICTNQNLTNCQKNFINATPFLKKETYRLFAQEKSVQLIFESGFFKNHTLDVILKK